MKSFRLEEVNMLHVGTGIAVLNIMAWALAIFMLIRG